MHHHRISKFQGQLRKYLLRYWVSGRFQYLDKLMNSWQQRKGERERDRERERERRRVGERTWKRSIRPPSIRALSEYPTVIFRARKWGAQATLKAIATKTSKNKKTNKQKTIGSISKTTTLRVKHTVWYISLSSLQNFHNVTFYSSMFTDPLFSLSRSSSARIDKNRRGQATFIIEDVNTSTTIFFFLFWTWIRSLRIQLLINSRNTHSSHITLSLSTDNPTDKLMEQRWVQKWLPLTPISSWRSLNNQL